MIYFLYEKLKRLIIFRFRALVLKFFCPGSECGCLERREYNLASRQDNHASRFMARGGVNEQALFCGILAELFYMGAFRLQNNGNKIPPDKIFVTDVDQHDLFLSRMKQF
jgi:hypothetical protein